jgi:hypothetical protein
MLSAVYKTDDDLLLQVQGHLVIATCQLEWLENTDTRLGLVGECLLHEGLLGEYSYKIGTGRRMLAT